MDKFDKLASLSSDMETEADGEQECHLVIGGQQLPQIPIAEVAMPGGKKMKVLKTMLTSACERNCNYCVFRAGRKMHRQTFKPEELAKTFLAVYEAGAVEGLFLSSGIIKGGVRTQDRLLDTADILRNKLGYRGYLHLKVMPGSERDQVRRAMQLGSRISVNLEAANPGRLPSLAPMKQFTEELLAPLKWSQEIRKTEEPRGSWNGRWASTITQFVVGPSGESDLELLSTSEYLYKQLGLSRTYYSGFVPIADTPLEGHAPEDPIREHRLYQSSFLLRDYGFGLEDMPFDQSGKLPLNKDPKTAWAEQNLLHTPIELNTASREQLLMVPGIGVQGAMTILKARRRHRIASLDDLRQLGIVTTRMKPYVLVNGRQPNFQLGLFDLPPPRSRTGPRAFQG
ncbi:MAG: radical SAM protein [Chloroflexi bacterium]|nr:radical SAM protein [Chloroflexota bacterium]